MPEQKQAKQQGSSGPPVDPEQMQTSFDMLALAIGQTSRDPGLLAQVQLQIEARRKALADQQLTALKVGGDLQKTAMQQQGESERTSMQVSGRLQQTQMEQQGAMDRTILQERGAGARAKLASDTARAGKEATQGADFAKLSQDAFGDAQTMFRGLISGDSGATAMMTAMLGSQVAPLLQKDPKDLTPEEASQVQFYQNLQSGSGKIGVDQAAEITAKFLGARVAGMPPEAAAMANASWDAFRQSFGLVPGVPPPREQVGAVVSSLTQRILQAPEGEEGAQIQAMMQTIVTEYGDDPEVQEQIVGSVMATVGQQIQAEGPEELAKYMGSVEAILADGIQAEDAGGLTQVLKDLKVPGFEEEGPSLGDRMKGIRERMRGILEQLPGTREQTERFQRKDAAKAEREKRK